MRLRIIEVGPDETDQEAIDRAAAEKPEAPRMPWEAYSSRLMAAIGLAMAGEGKPLPSGVVVELRALFCDDSLTRDILPYLLRPPQVCPVCGKTFRGLVGGEWACLPCRDAAAEEAKIRREVDKRTKGATT